MDKITISKKLAEMICKYCEDKQVYDKLTLYDDFYYQIKKQLREMD